MGLRVGVANGQNTGPNLTPRALEADIREMGRACDVIGYSELGEARDHRVLRDSLSQDVWWHAGHTECAVSGRHKVLRLIDHDTTWVLNRGLAGVNPRRPAEVAIVEHARRLRLPPFMIISTHWTNGAFSNPGQRAEEWRDDAWLDCWEATQGIVLDALREKMSVVLLGDLNARRVPRFDRRQEWLPGSRGIDKGATIEAPGGGLRFAHPDGHRRIELKSKHDGLVWNLGLRRP